MTRLDQLFPEYAQRPWLDEALAASFDHTIGAIRTRARQPQRRAG